MQLHGGECDQNDCIKSECGKNDGPRRTDLCPPVAPDAPMHGYIHRQIEKRTQRRDTAQIEKHGKKGCDDHRIDQRMPLDRTGHAEMAVRDHLHIRQHRQHPRDSKDTCQHGRRRGDDRQKNRQQEAHLPQCRFRCLGQRIVLGGDDLIDGQAGADTEGHKQIDDDTQRNRNDDCAPHIAVGISDLGPAVGDRCEPLECKDGKRHRGHETHRAKVARVLRRGGKAKPARPQGRDPEKRDAPDLDRGHDHREQPDGPVARDIHEKGKQDHPDRKDGHQRPALNVEGTQEVGGKCPRNKAFGNHHTERHQQRRPGRNAAGPVAFLQDHADAPCRGPGIGHLDIAVGTEAGDDCADDEGNGKERPGQFGNLPCQGKDPCPDHHARAHGNRAAQRNGVLLVAVAAVVVFHNVSRHSGFSIQSGLSV